MANSEDSTPWVGMEYVFEASVSGDEATRRVVQSLEKFSQEWPDRLASEAPTIRDTPGGALVTVSLAGTPQELPELVSRLSSLYRENGLCEDQPDTVLNGEQQVLAADNAVKAQEHLKRGLSLDREGKYGGALNEYSYAQDYCTDDDSFANVWFNRAVVHRKLGQYKYAVEDLVGVIRILPTDHEAFFNLALNLDDMGEGLLAQKAYEFFLARVHDLESVREDSPEQAENAVRHALGRIAILGGQEETKEGNAEEPLLPIVQVKKLFSDLQTKTMFPASSGSHLLDSKRDRPPAAPTANRLGPLMTVVRKFWPKSGEK